jgi:hypothetical protein
VWWQRSPHVRPPLAPDTKSAHRRQKQENEGGQEPYSGHERRSHHCVHSGALTAPFASPPSQMQITRGPFLLSDTSPERERCAQRDATPSPRRCLLTRSRHLRREQEQKTNGRLLPLLSFVVAAKPMMRDGRQEKKGHATRAGASTAADHLQYASRWHAHEPSDIANTWRASFEQRPP